MLTSIVVNIAVVGNRRGKSADRNRPRTALIKNRDEKILVFLISLHNLVQFLTHS